MHHCLTYKIQTNNRTAVSKIDCYNSTWLVNNQNCESYMIDLYIFDCRSVAAEHSAFKLFCSPDEFQKRKQSMHDGLLRKIIFKIRCSSSTLSELKCIWFIPWGFLSLLYFALIWSYHRPNSLASDLHPIADELGLLIMFMNKAHTF